MGVRWGRGCYGYMGYVLDKRSTLGTVRKAAVRDSQTLDMNSSVIRYI